MVRALAGRRPFASRDFATLANLIIQGPLPPLEDAVPGLPPGLREVAQKALAKSPHDRYPDLALMAAELLKAVGMPQSGDPPLSNETRRRAYAQNLEEAKRSMAEDDLEGALSAARRAQALEPSGREVVGLLEGIEAGLEGDDLAPTQVHAPVVTQIRARGAAVYRDLGTFGEPPQAQTTAFSPVRQELALAGNDGAVRLWDLAARRRTLVLRTEMHQRAGHDARAVCLAFSPDGKLLASGHVDGAIHLFDLTRGEEVPVKLRHEEMVSCLAFSPDGKALASGGTDTNLKLWDVAGCQAGESRRELYRQPSAMAALAYTDNGQKLVTAHTNRTLRVLDAGTIRLTATLRGPEAPVTLVRPDPKGQLLAAGSQDRLLRIFNLETGAPPLTLGPFRKPLTAACFFDDGRHLITAGLENVAQIWDLDSRAVMASLYGAGDESFVGVALYGSGDHVVAALADGRIRLWGPA